MTDIATLTIKLDEAVRMVDELPLLAQAEPRRDAARGATPGSAPAAGPAPASAAAASAGDDWRARALQAGGTIGEQRVSATRSARWCA